MKPDTAPTGVCKTIIPEGLYNNEHRCRWPAWRDGFCKKHHPEVKLATLTRQVARLRRQLATTEDALAKLKESWVPGTPGQLKGVQRLLTSSAT